MRRELVLAAGVAVVLAGATVTAAVVPGALATPAEENVRPSHLDLRDTTLAAADVSGGTVTLSVDTFLAHRGGPAENLTVVYRAVDLDTGLVAATTSTEVGTVSGEREVQVTGDLTVEREGGYRITTLVYSDGRRVVSGATEVRGVGTLTPAYARSPMRFHDFEGSTIPPVQYRIDSVAGNRTTLDVTSYVTNSGDDPAGDLRLVVTARQADSNIVADSAAVEIGSVRPGRTAQPAVSLTVPTEYNYYLDAVLWKDGVIISTARSAANLDPTETLTVNQTRREVGLRVSDFEEAGGGEGPRPTGTPAASGPGFGVAASIVALLAAALFARRWSP